MVRACDQCLYQYDMTSLKTRREEAFEAGRLPSLPSPFPRELTITASVSHDHLASATILMSTMPTRGYSVVPMKKSSVSESFGGG